MQLIINECYVLEMTQSIKVIDVNLKQKYRLKLPDAIIAATAIVNQIPLITTDADFKSIKELELIFLEK